MAIYQMEQTQGTKEFPALIPVKEAASLLDISEGGMRDKIRRGIVPGIKIGARVYVKRDEFMKQIEGGNYDVR